MTLSVGKALGCNIGINLQAQYLELWVKNILQNTVSFTSYKLGIFLLQVLGEQPTQTFWP